MSTRKSSKPPVTTGAFMLALMMILAGPALRLCAEGTLLQRLELRAGMVPFAGLDRILRGGCVEGSLGFRDSAFLPSATARLAYDKALGSWMLEGLLSLGLGPGLEIHGGLVLPLSVPHAETGGGQSLDLATMEPPVFFGLDAQLGTLSLGEGAFRLEVRALCDYRVWRLAIAREEGAPRPFRNGDTLAAFSLGFTAGISLRLGWLPFTAQGRGRY
ncbi:MAG: hypothetical protein WCL50_00855 [Spirochaetota bacterium]